MHSYSLYIVVCDNAFAGMQTRANRNPKGCDCRSDCRSTADGACRPIECGQETLDELENAFRFNDAVIRNLVIRRSAAITEASPMAKKEEREEQSTRPDSAPRSEAPAAETAEAPAAEA